MVSNLGVIVHTAIHSLCLNEFGPRVLCGRQGPHGRVSEELQAAEADPRVPAPQREHVPPQAPQPLPGLWGRGRIPGRAAVLRPSCLAAGCSPDYRRGPCLIWGLTHRHSHGDSEWSARDDKVTSLCNSNVFVLLFLLLPGLYAYVRCAFPVCARTVYILYNLRDPRARPNGAPGLSRHPGP